MYAVFTSGGKQYRVQEGDSLRVEKLDLAEGSSVEFDKVLLVGEGAEARVGTPYVEGGRVSATVEAHGRARKIKVVKFKRRTNYRRKLGHRQPYTKLRITGIETSTAE